MCLFHKGCVIWINPLSPYDSNVVLYHSMVTNLNTLFLQKSFGWNWVCWQSATRWKIIVVKFIFSFSYIKCAGSLVKSFVLPP